ncbi:MAG TPA: hypothetical protein V6D18_05295 [Thermosynechococcaceae cyanobacterium]
MVSSPGDRTEAQAQLDTFLTPAKLEQIARDAHISTEQVFRLIDGILPFEACLYHQLLPLNLEGSRLKLGMVSPDDAGALDYVRRILAYMNCSLVPQTITTQVHHAVLTAYLSDAGRRQNGAAKLSSPPASSETKQRETHSRNQTFMPTLLVDSPADLLRAEEKAALIEPVAPPPVAQEAPSVLPPSVSTSDVSKPASLTEENALPVLEVQAKHLTDPVEVLATLSPEALLQELLGRILIGGIGRLYFERQKHQGRILWSQNGVLQSVLEGLPIDVMQGMVIELKRLNRMSPLPVQKPKQVEVERLYQRQRLLLRLRVMPGAYGEEATLQVLRGAALKFYQQQQLATIGRDALGIAQELQQKVHELRQRSQVQPTLTAEQLSILPALNEVLQRVSQQLTAMQPQQSDSEAEP